MYYFASDVHLGAGDETFARRTEQRFVKWLDMVAKDAEGIFLVGDIFDFWFEYKNVIPKGFARTLGKIAELSDRGIKITLITGNHDMWMYDYLHKECGVEVFFTPQKISIYGKELFVAHGDNMNIKNQPILRLMNATFRSRIARKIFSWLVHPDIALAFGKWWSGKSRKSHSMEQLTALSLDFLIDCGRDFKNNNPTTNYIIFGHMHYPYEFNNEGLHVLFLSAWEGDVKYAALNKEGNIELKTFAV
ncbi:MAG: UDP-2,3-diacylglucosamine diphosphatase [Alistipes sp.]|nr:UDP-2,3-diacylglucosamine diphosphatase [Alistipes sp.]